jgi:Zn-dependent peptidase ImmA (M78 family)
MKVFHQYGSKQRLFEMMIRVNKLDEAILEREQKEQIIDKFVGNVNEYLELVNDEPNVVISHDGQEAADMASFGKYTPDTGEIRVVAVNRNLADVLRTLAHEMVHYKQHKEGRLQPDSNGDGSEIENEANAVAAIIMRKFGRDNPIIFE